MQVRYVNNWFRRLNSSQTKVVLLNVTMLTLRISVAKLYIHIDNS